MRHAAARILTGIKDQGWYTPAAVAAIPPCASVYIARITIRCVGLSQLLFSSFPYRHHQPSTYLQDAHNLHYKRLAHPASFFFVDPNTSRKLMRMLAAFRLCFCVQAVACGHPAATF
jgi:hypothetical protein